MLLLHLVACHEQVVQRPEWLNARTIIRFPADTLQFRAGGSAWTAALLTFSQPVPLELIPTLYGFKLTAGQPYGITEGPAQLMLASGQQHFYYPCMVQNADTRQRELMDYRSPKTVNPDSGLHQHRMIHQVDPWRNLVKTGLQEDSYFSEEELTLGPLAGTYRAQEAKPLSAYYVQPGTPVSLPVQWFWDGEESSYVVTAGPLKDAYGNTAANGTRLSFNYRDDTLLYQREATLLDGFATIRIPGAGRNYSLQVQADITRSDIIQLNHP